MRAIEIYSEANRQFSDRNRYVLMNARSPHKWWSTLKSVVFGGPVCESVSKAKLLSNHFDGRQSRESVDLPLTLPSIC